MACIEQNHEMTKISKTNSERFKPLPSKSPIPTTNLNTE